MRILVVALASSIAMVTPSPAQSTYVAFIPEMHVSEDVSWLPDAVQHKRDALIRAAVSGDPKQIAGVVAAQKTPAQFPSLSKDVEVALRENSKDDGGRQILGMMRDLLDLPFAIIPTSATTNLYVWPYLQHVDFSQATPRVTVDAYRVLSPQEYESAVDFGGWTGWRVVIDEDGNLVEFMVGGG
ncbi:hypothetical protein JHC09_06915 [Devosia sp. MC532]|uniref:hypothetical protein n=1 Tax=Devosia sp. MC532 TaxID=2799788 RepID=UPI0018F63174|nr:hypothetical protein [Devosia sp. MC532]MBJ7577615.1 hypothetical protein [Devosia sp. MC532]